MFRDTVHVINKVTGEEYFSFPNNDGILHLEYVKDETKNLNKGDSFYLDTMNNENILIDFNYKGIYPFSDIDFIALLINDNGQVVNAVTPFMDIKEQPHYIKYALEGIDDETLEDKDIMSIQLKKIPENIKKIIFIGYIYNSDFSMVTEANMVLYNKGIWAVHNKSFAEFNMGKESTNNTCKIIASMVRDDCLKNNFRFNPINKSLNISDINEIFKMSFL